jgi:hypothetical protein
MISILTRGLYYPFVIVYNLLPGNLLFVIEEPAGLADGLQRHSVFGERTKVWLNGRIPCLVSEVFGQSQAKFAERR